MDDVYLLVLERDLTVHDVKGHHLPWTLAQTIQPDAAPALLVILKAGNHAADPM